jgi:N-succinyldiaminopimelate aminotransferase
MPKHPDVNASAAAITEVLFSELALRLQNHRGEVYPLHVGETWLRPPRELENCRLSIEQYPDLYQYSPSYGRPDLLELLAHRLSALANAGVVPAQMLVAAGAMGALTSICNSILSPGDEVLILAPHWPLIPGIVRISGGIPIVIPFWGEVGSETDVARQLDSALSQRTACIYINSPNNPTGRILPERWVHTILEFARTNHLWVLSDEVYADYSYGRPHVYVYPLAPERTFSVYSFSKSYGVPGHRCGYAVGPEQQIRIARRISTHISYGAPTASQIAAVNLLQAGNECWIADARLQYTAAEKAAANQLRIDRPEGGHFLFFDGGRVLRRIGMQAFLESAVKKGLLVAPGTMCGPYPNHLRVCFTCLPPDAVLRGIEILADLLAE